MKYPRPGGWRWPMPPLAPAAMCAFALVLAGCSGDAAADSAASSSSKAPSSVQEIERALFGFDGESSDADLKRAQAESEAYEERVIRCMTNAGFEYYAAVIDVQTYGQSDVDYMSREYAEQNGFGYTTGMDDPAQYQMQSYEDPNSDYVNSLSPSEQEQYNVTLYGDQSFWDSINSEEERIALEEEQPELFEQKGCWGEAQSESSRTQQAYWNSHSDEINEMYESAENHQLVQAPLKLWQECMAEHGHMFTTPDDFDSVMDPYMNRLFESSVQPGSGLTEDEMAAMTEDELNAHWSQPPQYDEDLLAEAQAYEIELAVTSWDCGMEDLYASYQDALSMLRQQYIEANMAELSALITQ